MTLQAEIAEKNSHAMDDGVIDKQEQKELDRAHKQQLRHQQRGIYVSLRKLSIVSNSQATMRLLFPLCSVCFSSTLDHRQPNSIHIASPMHTEVPMVRTAGMSFP